MKKFFSINEVPQKKKDKKNLSESVIQIAVLLFISLTLQLI